MAMEVLPGSLVNLHVKEKLYRKYVPVDEKNRLLDEITKEHLDPADLIEIECKPCPPLQQQTLQVMLSKSEATKPDETEPKSIIVHHEKLMLNAITTIEDETDDNVEEFRSPAKKGAPFVDDQDQRVFIYTPLKTQNADRSSSSSFKDDIYKPLKDEVEFEVFYNNSPELARDEFVPSFRMWLDEEESETFKGQNLSRKSVSSSRRHVHVKLSNCDELEAMFMALKHFHQQTTF